MFAGSATKTPARLWIAYGRSVGRSVSINTLTLSHEIKKSRTHKSRMKGTKDLVLLRNRRCEDDTLYGPERNEPSTEIDTRKRKKKTRKKLLSWRFIKTLFIDSKHLSLRVMSDDRSLFIRRRLFYKSSSVFWPFHLSSPPKEAQTRSSCIVNLFGTYWGSLMRKVTTGSSCSLQLIQNFQEQ